MHIRSLRSLPLIPRWGLPGLVLAACLGATEAQAQVEVVLDVESLRVQDGSLVFQFASEFGMPTDFELQSMREWTMPPVWTAVDGGQVEGIAEGLFRAVVPGIETGTRFVRVRSWALPPIGPAPLINEVMTDNVSAFGALPGQFWDWVELFNPHDEAVSLAGYGLTDDPLRPGRWKFPSVTMQPGGLLLVHATDAEVSETSGLLVTGFGLSSGGETLLLTDPHGREVERFDVPPLAVDESVGRVPDGSDIWQRFGRATVTPGRTNGPATAAVVVEAPRVSRVGGFLAGPLDVEVTPAVAGQGVAFTTDGSPATAQSPRMTGPLRVMTNTVLRVVAVDGAGRVSAEQVHTYLMGRRPTLPVVMMAASPTNFGFRDGYLVGMGTSVVNAQGQVVQNFPFDGSNAWKDREAAVHVEFREPDGRVGFRQHAGLKVFGGWGSRGYPQKSMALFARRKYGNGSFQHAVFPGQDVDRFESLVLRNSGNDNQSTYQTMPRPPITAFGPTASWGSYFVRGNFTLMRDAMMQRLLEGTGLDTQGYRPAVLYVNGEYWGIHNLREKLTDQHVRAHHELPEGSVDVIEGYGTAQAGDSVAYRAMRDFINNRNLTTGTNYQHVVDTYLDVGNFIDYNLAVLFFQNFDIGNIKCWRPRVPKGRFRWLVYDQDYGFNLWPTNVYPAAMARDYADYGNMFRFATAGTGTSTAWPNAGGRTLLLRRMLTNAQFREQFIRRCADLLNTHFEEQGVQSVITTTAAVIRPEIPFHLERWSWPELQRRGFGLPHRAELVPLTASLWETHVAGLGGFAQDRPRVLREQCIAHFGLTGGLGRVEVDVVPAGSGDVRVNTVVPKSYPWSGVYFGNFATTLRAVARPGYRFVGWTTAEGTNGAARLDRRVTNGGVDRLVATFEPIPAGTVVTRQLVISEINYHSPDDLQAGDWIEILNPGATAVGLGGWTVRDGADDHVVFLPDVTLAAGGRVVVCRNRARFQVAHPNVVDPVAEMSFGLDNGGDQVRLMDPQGNVSMRVAYSDSSPWPVAADGAGSTLQWVRADLDPASALAWAASVTRGGTPGAP
jgi:hypothetical protein